MCDMRQVLVVQDTDQIVNSRNMLSLVETMHEEGSYHVSLLALTKDVDSVIGYFHRIITVPEILQGPLHLAGICDVVEDLQRQHHYCSILIPATRVGRMLAPRMARRLRTGLVADVTEVRQRGDTLMMIRSAYSGNIMAGITSVGDGPIMMSVHPDSFSHGRSPRRQTKISLYQGQLRSHSTLRLVKKEMKPPTYDIRDSEVLVSGGGGINRHFSLVEQLAESLGGVASASRKLVDQGVAPRSIQVGQSGKMVRPRLYFALGIHGAIQHIEGLREVETIIAVNTSAKAPICSLSDIVVEGDAKVFVEKLLARIHDNGNTHRGES